MTVDDEVNVTASAARAAARIASVTGGALGAVGLDHVDRPALGPQPVGQHVARDRGRGRAAPGPAPDGNASTSASATKRVGHQVGGHAPPPQRGGGARPDGRDPRRAEGPRVAQLPAEPLGAVGRREHHPVVLVHPGGGGAQRGAAVGRVDDADRRQLDRVGAERRAAGPPASDAWSRARVTTTRRPNSGRRLEPAQVEPGHRADDDRRGRLERRPRRAPPSVVRTVRCSGRVPHRTAATGVSRGQPAGHQARRDRAARGHAHQHDDRAADPGDRVPVGVLRGPRVLVAGDDGERRRQAAVGHGDAGVGGHRDRRGDAGHDLERHAGREQRGGLLAAAGEHERVAALEPHDLLAGAARARRAAR